MLRKLGQYLGGCFRMILLGSVMLSGVGCSSPEELTPEQASALVQRVEDRWQTIINRDFGATWEFASPNYRRVFSKRMYLGNFSYGLDWELTGIEVLNYDGRAAVASVVARVMTKSTKPTSAASKALGSRPISIRERWMFIDGEWWHIANI